MYYGALMEWSYQRKPHGPRGLQMDLDLYHMRRWTLFLIDILNEYHVINK
jgi:hypothetical protein